MIMCGMIGLFYLVSINQLIMPQKLRNQSLMFLTFGVLCLALRSEMQSGLTRLFKKVQGERFKLEQSFAKLAMNGKSKRNRESIRYIRRLRNRSLSIIATTVFDTSRWLIWYEPLSMTHNLWLIKLLIQIVFKVLI